jgi:hypothetical protein
VTLTRNATWTFAVLVITGCTPEGDHPAPPVETTASAASSAMPSPSHHHEGRNPDEAAPHYGDVMATIGRRYELAGRAAEARRFALAAYEIEELQEALEEDLPRAKPPREGDPKKLAALTEELRERQLVALAKAAEEGDGEEFGRAFALAAQTCNACHQATGHAFVQISERPGDSVPRLDRLAPDE